MNQCCKTWINKWIRNSKISFCPDCGSKVHHGNNLEDFTIGSVVQKIGSNEKWIISGNFEDTVTAFREIFITNPDEWVIINRNRRIIDS